MSARRQLLGFFVASLIATAALAPASFAATPNDGWTAISARLSADSNGRELEVAPRTYKSFQLNHAAFRAALSADPTAVSIPAPDGELERFSVVESPVMEPELAAKVSSFKSYSVTGVDDPTAKGRIDISPLGFHATIRSDRGAWYVDPAYRNNRSTYVSYKHGTLKKTRGGFEEESLSEGLGARPSTFALPTAGSLVQQRTYRMALVGDPKYVAYFGGAANADFAKATLINRVNEVYNDDMAIHFVLVANNDLLNFTTESELTAACGVGQEANCYQTDAGTQNLSCDGNLEPNQLAIDNIIGDANYDIGHFVSTGQDGGLASKGVGQSGLKARGCSGLDDPVGDNLAVEFMGHEIGHQFGAAHAFNASGYCNPNRSAEGAIEPGSGSSIMSYAGVCGSDDIQGQSDPYFNQFSINQMQDYVNETIPDANNGGEISTASGNHSPVVTVTAAHAIPPRTPFTLTGSATDADSGDAPVYIWEQSDLAGATGTELIDNNKVSGPLFRQFSTAAIVPDYELQYNAAGESVATTTDNTRTFPDLAQILAGNTNAATGVCPTADAPTPTAEQVECFSEFLPTSARTMHFTLIARDRHANGGGVSAAETTVTVSGTTPFAVNTPVSTSVQGNRDHTLTWNVAGTTAAPLNVANVRVLYSTDGGLTFPTVVSASTPNDGTQTFTMPNTATTTGRFKVEAIGQPFFDISHADLNVTPNEPLVVVNPPVVVPPVVVPPVLTPQATVFRPVLTGIASKLKPSKSGKVKLKISCAPVDPALLLPTTCAGKVKLTAKIRGKKRTIGSAKFSLAGGTARTITVKLSSRAKTALKSGSLKVKVEALVDETKSTRSTKIRKR